MVVVANAQQAPWRLPESDLAMDFVEREGFAPLRIKGTGFQSIWNRRKGKALLALCERNYWRRVWVVQEIMNAKDLTVYCGGKSFPWPKIDRIVEKLKTIADKGRIEHHQHALEVLASPAYLIIEAKSAWDGHPIPLKSLLTTYRNLQSTDIRNKMSGLLGLASITTSVVVNYSLHPTEIFLCVLKSVCTSDCLGDGDEMMRFGSDFVGHSGTRCQLRVYGRKYIQRQRDVARPFST